MYFEPAGPDPSTGQYKYALSVRGQGQTTERTVSASDSFFYRIEYLRTVWHRNNESNFQLKKAQFLFRSIFLKFCMQVPMILQFIYIKSKKSRRPNRGYVWPTRQAIKRMTVIFHVKTSQKVGMKALVMLSCVLFYSALHGGGDQGCQNAYKSGLPFAAIFLTLYI